MRRAPRAVVALVLLVVGIGCGGATSGPRPLVGEIPAAIAAMNEAFGGTPDLEYFEISADLTGVSLVLAEHEMGGDTGDVEATYATSFRWQDDSLDQVGESAQAEGATFLGSQVAIDPQVIFRGIEDELDSPSIVDLAVQGSGTGDVVIDVTVENAKGGRLLVLVDTSGRVLGVQAD